MSPKDTRSVSRAELETLLEPLLLNRLGRENRTFRLRSFTPVITANRLDLATKLAFLESLDDPGTSFAARLYDRHIAAFSLGLAEPGDPTKRGSDVFRETFMALLRDMRQNGFDPQRSLIPLASDGTILNGAHRVACAIHLGIPLLGVETGLEPFCYDGAYFHRRGMLDEDLDAMTLAHVTRARDAAIVMFWPAARQNLDAALELLGPLVCKREIKLSMQGAHNFLSEIHAGESRIGPAEEGFPGLIAKREQCFRSERPLRVMVVHLEPARDRQAILAELRSKHQLTEDAVYLTRSQEEAIRVSRLLFNRQSLHFLNHAAPCRDPELARHVDSFRAAVTHQGGDAEQTVMGRETVLGLYGLRKADAVDYLSAAKLELPSPFRRDVLPETAPEFGDICNDPRWHFHFRDQRFLALPLLARIMEGAGNARDTADMALIRPLLQPLEPSRWDRRRARLRLARARAKHGVIVLLDLLGIKHIARRAHRALWPRG